VQPERNTVLSVQIACYQRSQQRWARGYLPCHDRKKLGAVTNAYNIDSHFVIAPILLIILKPLSVLSLDAMDSYAMTTYIVAITRRCLVSLAL
jgi:hypothetical protein